MHCGDVDISTQPRRRPHTLAVRHTHTLLSACVRRQDRSSMSQNNRTAPHTHTAPYRIHMKGGGQSRNTPLCIMVKTKSKERRKEQSNAKKRKQKCKNTHSTVYHGDIPSQTRRGDGKGPENPLSESVYDQIDQPTTGTGTQEHIVYY